MVGDEKNLKLDVSMFRMFNLERLLKFWLYIRNSPPKGAVETKYLQLALSES